VSYAVGAIYLRRVRACLMQWTCGRKVGAYRWTWSCAGRQLRVSQDADAPIQPEIIMLCEWGAGGYRIERGASEVGAAGGHELLPRHQDLTLAPARARRQRVQPEDDFDLRWVRLCTTHVITSDVSHDPLLK
jgi:hypothetical protein